MMFPLRLNNTASPPLNIVRQGHQGICFYMSMCKMPFTLPNNVFIQHCNNNKTEKFAIHCCGQFLCPVTFLGRSTQYPHTLPVLISLYLQTMVEVPTFNGVCSIHTSQIDSSQHLTMLKNWCSFFHCLRKAVLLQPNMLWFETISLQFYLSPDCFRTLVMFSVSMWLLDLLYNFGKDLHTLFVDVAVFSRPFHDQ